MGRFDQVRAGIRRAYQAGVASVRAAREREAASNGVPRARQDGSLAMPAGAAALASGAAGPGAAGPGEGGPGESGVAAAPPAVTSAPPPPPSAQSTASRDDGEVPRSLRIAAAWSWRLIVVGVVGWVLLWLVDRFLILVAPMMIGLLLTGLLLPALRWLLKLRLNRTVATTLVLVGGLAAVAGTLTLVVNQFIAGLPQLAENAADAIRQIQTWLRSGPLHLDDDQFDQLLDQGQQWITENQGTLTTGLMSAAGGLVQLLTGMVLSLVVTFFFLRDGRRIWTFLVSMTPVAARAPLAYAGDGAWRSLSSYVRATVLVAFIDAVGIGLGLWILQVPFVLPLAALVFLGAFIPVVGAFVSGTVAVLVALVDDGLVKALLVLGVVILVQQIEGNVLQPVIMSRAVSIHPLAVIVAVTAGALLAGIIGALVAVPFVAVVNSAVRRLSSYHNAPSARPDPSLAHAD